MRKLIIILTGLIAMVTFIRAFDNPGSAAPRAADQINSEAFQVDQRQIE